MSIVDRYCPRKRAVGVIGHRGSKATHPENSLEAFRHAIQCGADAVELDIVVTTDRQLAVTHDPVYAAFADLPASVPALQDVLALAEGSDIVFDIEMKSCGVLTPEPARYAQMLLDRLNIPVLAGRVMIRSFEHLFLRAVRKLRTDIPLLALVESNVPDWVETCRAAGACCISPRFRHVSADAVRLAHAAHIEVVPWTVNKPEHWASLIAMGVDAIVTDDPAELISCLDRGGFR